MKKILYTIATAILAAACVEENYRIAEPNPVFDITLNGVSVLEGPAQEIEFEKTLVLNYTSSGISKVTATAPQGWSCNVSSTMAGTKEISITAPEYADPTKSNSGVVTFHLYDGTGSYTDRTLAVTATEGGMSFSIVTPTDVTTTQEFTKGSSIEYLCDMSASVKTLEFQLPDGWTGTVNREQNSFRIIAPLFNDTDAGEAEDGTVTVTPVSWSDKKGEALTISLEVLARLVSTFEFVDTRVSFNYGETKSINVTAPAILSVNNQVCPQGWAVDYSDIATGTVKITAPEKNVEHVTYGTVTASGLYPGDDTADSNQLNVRLRGINNLEELHSFLDAYGRANGAERKDISDYTVNDTIKLNNDITVPQEEFTVQAFLAYKLDTPLDGNNKTITATCNGTNGVVCLFQNLATDVRNLKIAGNMSVNQAGGNARLAALAASPTKNVTITNVHSSVNLTHYYGENSASHCGGLIANAPSNINTTFVNCSVSGDITIKDRIKSCGGIMGTTGEGNTNKVIIRNCEYSGNLSYTCTAATASNRGRVGGLVGDQARALYIYDSKVSAKSFTANLNSKGVYSIGGIVGNTTAAADTYTMELHLENVTNEADIVINGYNDTIDDKGNPAGKPMEHNFGQIYGNGKEAAAAKKDIIKAYSVTLDGSITVNIHDWSSTGHYYDEATKTIVESDDLGINRTVSGKATN